MEQAQVDNAVRSPERLRALRDVDLLDTPPEEIFDQLARLAARLLNVPVALISLVDKDRQFFKSCIGEIPEPFYSQRQTPLSHSFCQYVVAAKEPLLVGDARQHPVLKNNLAVLENGVIAYMGIPLITPEGHALGTLCVVDSKPRQWSEEQVETLCSLTASVMSTISLRAAARARQPAPPEEHPAPGPDKRQTQLLAQAGDALDEAVSTYLRCLDAYDQCIQSPSGHDREMECQRAVLEAEKRLQQATQAFGERLEASGGEPDDPRLQAAVELSRMCWTYFDAEKRRSEVVKRFQELKVALSEVEHEVMLVSRAEQALRMALRAYELSRE